MRRSPTSLGHGSSCARCSTSRRWWDEIGESTDIALDHQLELYLDCRRTAERCSLWFLRHRRPPVDIGVEVDRFRGPCRRSPTELSDCLRGRMRDDVAAMRRSRVAAGRARRAGRPDLRCGGCCTPPSTWSSSPTASASRRSEACAAYWTLFDRLELIWLWDGIGALPRSDRWQTQARGALRDDLLTALAELTENVLDSPERTVDGGGPPTSGRCSGRWPSSPRSAAPMASTSPTCRWRSASSATWR